MVDLMSPDPRRRFLSATLSALWARSSIEAADRRYSSTLRMGVFTATSKTFCTATPALHKPVPQLKQIFIKNIRPKFHFGRQLSSLVAVSETSITTRNVEG